MSNLIADYSHCECDPNIPLLRKMLEWVESAGREWDQNYWIMRTNNPECGTTYCIAGKIAVDICGATPLWTPLSPSTMWVSLEGEENPQDVKTVASETLGLCLDHASTLFTARNRTPSLVRSAAEFLAGERL